jgi:hypothetical protein
MNYLIGEIFFRLPGRSLGNCASAMARAVKDLSRVHGLRQKSKLAMKDLIGEIFLFAPADEAKALW